MKPPKHLVLIAILFFLLGCNSSKQTPLGDNKIKTKAGVKSIPGGTVHSMADLGRYPQACDQESAEALWKSDLKLILAYFNRYQNKIENQLKAMTTNGQTKSSLLIWFVQSSSATEIANENIYGGHALIPTTGGKLKEEYLENLKNYILLLEKHGFDEFQIRFAPQGFADPSSWNLWQESQYQENRTFIFSTISEIEKFKAQENLKINFIWDLGVEGATSINQARSYIKRLWKEYSERFDINKSYGFSLAYNDLRLRDYLQDIKGSGAPWPGLFAFDIYDGESIYSVYQAFSEIKEILQEAGQDNKPIILQESYYNDAQVMQDVLRARNELGLNISSVMQWPVSRVFAQKHFGLDVKKFNIHFTEENPEFFAGQAWSPTYTTCGSVFLDPSPPLAKPEIYNAGSGASDHFSLWVVGSNFASNDYVEILSVTSGQVLAKYGVEFTDNANNDGKDLITLRIGNSAVQREFAYNGVKIRVVHRRDESASNVFVVYRDPAAPKPPPVTVAPPTPTPPPPPPPPTPTPSPQIRPIGKTIKIESVQYFSGGKISLLNDCQLAGDYPNTCRAELSIDPYPSDTIVLMVNNGGADQLAACFSANGGTFSAPWVNYDLRTEFKTYAAASCSAEANIYGSQLSLLAISFTASVMPPTPTPTPTPPPSPTPPVAGPGLNNFGKWKTPYVGFYAGAISGVGSGNYMSELSSLSNVVFVAGTDADLINKLNQARNLGLKVIVSTRWNFFNSKGEILSNYLNNWQSLKNQLAPYRENILAIYLADEPFWIYSLSHSPESRHMDWVRDWLNHLSDIIKSDWPEVKTAIVEAYTMFNSNEFLNPSKVDWVGVDCYESFVSCGGKGMTAYYNQLKTMLAPNQKLIVVPAVGKSVHSSRSQAEIIQDLALFDQLVQADSRFVLTVPFLWQSFGDTNETWTGARDFNLIRQEMTNRSQK